MPPPAGGDQPFFAFSASRTWKISCKTEFDFSAGDNAITSDAAATMIHVIGDVRISSMLFSD